MLDKEILDKEMLNKEMLDKEMLNKEMLDKEILNKEKERFNISTHLSLYPLNLRLTSLFY
jgi:hypothetical protein